MNLRAFVAGARLRWIPHRGSCGVAGGDSRPCGFVRWGGRRGDVEGHGDADAKNIPAGQGLATLPAGTEGG